MVQYRIFFGGLLITYVFTHVFITVDIYQVANIISFVNVRSQICMIIHEYDYYHSATARDLDFGALN